MSSPDCVTRTATPPFSVAYPFSIEVCFSSAFTGDLKNLYIAAVERWLKIVVGGGPPFTNGSEVIDGIRIMAEIAQISGGVGLAAETLIDPNYLRGATAGTARYLPALATITLDPDTLTAASPTVLYHLVSHEIGHAIGFVKDVWIPKELLQKLAPDNPVFVGGLASQKYTDLRPLPNLTPVPLENYLADDTFISHWRQFIFHSELMTAILEDGQNPIGPVTAAALKDMGYEVDKNAVETPSIDLISRTLTLPGPDGIYAPEPLYMLNCHLGLGRPDRSTAGPQQQS